MSNIKSDKIKLIDYSIELVKTLLLEYQEYYPCATTIDLDGEVIPISYFDGDDYPQSADLIDTYQVLLDKKINLDEIRAYSIAYDVRVNKNSEGEKTDAIAIKVKHTETDEVIVYFYSYTLSSEGKLTMGDSWGEIQ